MPKALLGGFFGLLGRAGILSWMPPAAVLARAQAQQNQTSPKPPTGTVFGRSPILALRLQCLRGPLRATPFRIPRGIIDGGLRG